MNGAGYVYRGTSFDDDLTQRLVDAIRHPGFALVDIWELCTAYYVRANHFSRRAIAETMDGLGLVAGVLYDRDVTDYATAKASDTARFGRFFHAMLERGVALPPAQFEAAFVSTAHTDAEIDATLEAARSTLKEL